MSSYISCPSKSFTSEMKFDCDYQCWKKLIWTQKPQSWGSIFHPWHGDVIKPFNVHWQHVVCGFLLQTHTALHTMVRWCDCWSHWCRFFCLKQAGWKYSRAVNFSCWNWSTTLQCSLKCNNFDMEHWQGRFCHYAITVRVVGYTKLLAPSGTTYEICYNLYKSVHSCCMWLSVTVWQFFLSSTPTPDLKRSRRYAENCFVRKT